MVVRRHEPDGPYPAISPRRPIRCATVSGQGGPDGPGDDRRPRLDWMATPDDHYTAWGRPAIGASHRRLVPGGRQPLVAQPRPDRRSRPGHPGPRLGSRPGRAGRPPARGPGTCRRSGLRHRARRAGHWPVDLGRRAKTGQPTPGPRPELGPRARRAVRSGSRPGGPIPAPASSTDERSRDRSRRTVAGAVRESRPPPAGRCARVPHLLPGLRPVPLQLGPPSTVTVRPTSVRYPPCPRPSRSRSRQSRRSRSWCWTAAS